MTQLKDVIHFYLGQEIEMNGVRFILTPSRLETILNGYTGYKLCTRRLDSMTEEEAIEVTKPVVVYGDLPNVRKYETWENPFGKIVVSWGSGLREKYVPQDETAFIVSQFTYLLSRGFDLFNLIETNQAIDKNKITTP